MWLAFVNRALVAVALAAAFASCGPRALDLSLTVDGTGCTLSVPIGGSLLYQLEADGSGAGAFCGGCLGVDKAIATSDDLIAFLRTHAPSCGGVHPGTTIGVRITAWSSGGCAAAIAPAFCADAPTVLVPDGTSDASVALHLVCKPQCSSSCTPTTCAAQGKDCGAISDGCNMVLDCGTCHPPLRCGAVTPNVCGR
ncbi:MAG: hypothetical protein LC659_00275 [Myxococcales bacterium]|nr:hypothetical protein [Myxococcales bacterium]